MVRSWGYKHTWWQFQGRERTLLCTVRGLTPSRFQFKKSKTLSLEKALILGSQLLPASPSSLDNTRGSAALVVHLLLLGLYVTVIVDFPNSIVVTVWFDPKSVYLHNDTVKWMTRWLSCIGEYLVAQAICSELRSAYFPGKSRGLPSVVSEQQEKQTVRSQGRLPRGRNEFQHSIIAQKGWSLKTCTTPNLTEVQLQFLLQLHLRQGLTLIDGPFKFMYV